jgi:hypothetical protein
VNALFPKNYTIGVAASLHARHVASASSLDDAVARACGLSPASGQHLNVGSIHEPDRQLMIETSPHKCVVRTLRPPATRSTSREGNPQGAEGAEGSAELTHAVPEGEAARATVTVGFHANLYESASLKGTDDHPRPSSSHRMARMAELPPASSVADLEAVISDTKDREYPIHRKPHIPDLAETLNSVLFDVSARRVSVWGTTAPTKAAKPDLLIDWQSMEVLNSGA